MAPKLVDTIKLTETQVELADCHTTLYYLGAKAPAPASLPLSTKQDYTDLYQKIAGPQPTPYADVSGRPGVMLAKLTSMFHKNDYWKSFFANEKVLTYPGLAWDFLAPILCSLKIRINFIPDPRFKFRVSPLPKVILYPFGWSTSLSLRLLGEHTLRDLAEFNQYLFSGKAFRLDPVLPPPAQSDFSAPQFFDYVADGVRTDVFDPLNTKDFSPNEAVVVTTVLAKHGAKAKIEALGTDEREILLRIVKPDGPLPQDSFSSHVYDLPYEKTPPKYMVFDNYGRFIWMEERLEATDRNYQHLLCYKNNTFNSLVHARHLYQLLSEAAQLPKLSKPLSRLTAAAVRGLTSPSEHYENASLRAFLLEPTVANAKKAMEKFDKESA
jgi:hypothetical protein